MVDFARQRQNMVDGQVRVNDVTDPRILAAMLEIPRELFVPKNRVALSYIDEDIQIREAHGAAPARFLTEPMVLAKLVQALEVTEEERALVIGCATGYSAALLSFLAREVVALEGEEALAATARKLLVQPNITVVSGPMNAGWPYAAPYDAILIDGSVEYVPEPSPASSRTAAGLWLSSARDAPPRRSCMCVRPALSARGRFSMPRSRRCPALLARHNSSFKQAIPSVAF
jgi:protein-L-isoaspartate(D-aspartate) O-methyltransferase